MDKDNFANVGKMMETSANQAFIDLYTKIVIDRAKQNSKTCNLF